LKTGVIANAVNVPSVSGDVLAQVGPYINLGEMLGSLHMQIAKGSVQDVSIEYSGELADMNASPITVAFFERSVYSHPSGCCQLCKRPGNCEGSGNQGG